MSREYVSEVHLVGLIQDARIETAGEKETARATLSTMYAYRDRYGNWVFDHCRHDLRIWKCPATQDLHALRKGTPVEVSGRLHSTRRRSADGTEHTETEVYVNRLTVLDLTDRLIPQNFPGVKI